MHALAKNRQPYTSFMWMCDMQEMSGLDLGLSYRSDKNCHEFCHYMAEVERKKLMQKYKESSFTSLVLDDANNSSVREYCYIVGMGHLSHH